MRKLAKADEELSEYFTASIGVGAQQYEGTIGGAFDSWNAHSAIFSKMKSRVIDDFDATAATLAQLEASHRQVIDLVYAPHGSGFSASDSKVEGPDLLALALSPRWGHGNFVRLALTLNRTRIAHEKQHPGKSSDRARLLAFLGFEAGRGDKSASFFRRLREECEGPRTIAVEAYDALRVSRVEEEIRARRAARAEIERRNEKLLERDLGARRERERQRFERRLRTIRSAS